jgi:ABC-type amino acid transport substrate-binding protein
MTVGEAFTEEKYGVAFCKDNDELRGVVDEALYTLINDGTVDGLIAKWLVTSAE